MTNQIGQAAAEASQDRSKEELFRFDNSALVFIDMRAEGLKTTFPADAVGGTSKEAHDLAVQRMIQAGSVPSTTFAMMAEWALDRASPQGPILREVAPRIQELLTQEPSHV